MASPKSPATDSVVIFTPSIAGRWTVSVVINSSMLDFRNLSMPVSLKMAWETQARICLAPFFFNKRRGFGQSAGGFRQVIHHQHVFALDFADDGHAFDFRGAFAAFGHDGQARFQAPGNRHGPFSSRRHPG